MYFKCTVKPACLLKKPAEKSHFILVHYRAKKVPIIIRRFLPDRSYEDWAVEELITD